MIEDTTHLKCGDWKYYVGRSFECVGILSESLLEKDGVDTGISKNAWVKFIGRRHRETVVSTLNRMKVEAVIPGSQINEWLTRG